MSLHAKMMGLVAQHDDAVADVPSHIDKFLRRLTFGVALVALLLPLLPSYAIGTDFAEHVSLIEQLVRIVRGDQATRDVFMLSIQPLNYHLFYVVGAAMALLLGSDLACRLLIVAVGTALVWRAHRYLSHRLAYALTAPVAMIYYGALFRWGFIPNILACGIALIVLIELIDERPSSTFGPTLIAMAAVATHIMAYPAIVIVTLACVLTRQKKRQHALYALVMSSLLTLPGLIWAASIEHSTMRSSRHSLRFNDLTNAAWSLWAYVIEGDSLLVSATNVGLACLLVVLAFIAWPSKARAPKTLWTLLLVAGGAIALLRLCPTSSPGKVTTAVQLEWRNLPLAALALLLIGAHASWWQQWATRYLLSAVAIVLPLGHALGLMLMGMLLDEQIVPWPVASLSPRAKIASVQQEMKLPEAAPPDPAANLWPLWVRRVARPYVPGGPLMQRVHAVMWAIPRAGALFNDEQFTGNHVPIALRDANTFVRSAAVARTLTQTIAWRTYMAHPEQMSPDFETHFRLRPKQTPDPSLWNVVDLVWWETPHLALLLQHVGSDARLVARGWDWAVLGPPEGSTKIGP